MENIEEMYQTYFQTVYRYVLYLSDGNVAVSEDITAETFVAAMEKIHTFRGTCKISVWLCQIAKYLFYKEIKRKKKLKWEDIETIQEEQNIEESLLEKEDRAKLWKDMKQLEETTRNVMYLRVIGNLSFEEIAVILGKTANWARVTYFRGKEKLKEVNRDGNQKGM